ncbi:MAG: glycosyltransferase family 39 protein [Planctomycetes bacterium]|nr:glycosyltransferase family 39 protein [Planctomycetota bacterium]
MTTPTPPAALRGLPSNVGWTLTAFVVVALLIRLPFLDHSVWFDEACMANQRIGTWPQLLAVLYRDIHPPLYVAFMFCWNSVFGDGEASMRMPPLIAGLVSIPLTYWAGHRLVGRNAALWASMFLALSPVHVWYSGEARLYAPMVACALVAVGTFDRILDPTLPRRRWLWWVHLANVAVMLSLHYYLAVLVVLLAVAAPLLRGFDRTAVAITLWHGVGLLLLGAFAAAKIAIGELATDQDYLRAMTAKELYLFVFDWCWTGHTLLAVDNLLDDLAAWSQEAIGIVLIAVGVVQLVKARRAQPAGLLVPAFALAIPTFLWGAALVGLDKTYIERSALPSLPFVYLLAGCGLANLPSTARRTVGGAVLLLCIASLIALHAFHQEHWTVYKPHPDWRSATAYLSREIDHDGAGRAVFTSTPNPRSLSYYDDRIQHVQNLTSPETPEAVGEKVRKRLGRTIGDYAEGVFREFVAHDARLLANAKMLVHRSASDPDRLRALAPMPDGICYLVRDHWHPNPAVDHTIEDLLVNPRVQVLESRHFVAVSVHKVRLLP